MLYSDFTAKLLEMEDVIVTSFKHHSDFVEIYLDLKPQKCACPECKSTENTVHDYRTQRIKDIPILGKHTVLVLRKRRYRCKQCGKRFAQPVPFLPRYYRMTNRLSAFVINKLADTVTFTSVAKEAGISVSTAVRIFSVVNYRIPKELTKVLAIDEFKGNTRGEKYQCIITDPENKVVLDILPNRYETSVMKYLRSSERSKVKYFVSDMWKPYSRIADALLPEAVQLVDKYHYVRQAIWAFDAVRKRAQHSSFRRSTDAVLSAVNAC